jgi:HAD superfamily hydrolase (TIGR01509 family)
VIAAVIFDMGGVLVELGPISDILGDGGRPAEELWSDWLASEAVREFEMGRCTATEFGAALAAELGGALDGAEIIRRFQAWPRGLFPGAADMVMSISSDLDVGLLSNTNELHWTTQQDNSAIQSLFPRAYLSYDLGLAKPDAEIFEYLVADLDLAPSEVLFVDDNAINVAGARAVGITAEVVIGVSAAQAALARHSVRRRATEA